MDIRRRRFLTFVGATAVSGFVPDLGRADSYPTRPIRLIVGYVAGGPNDIVARLLAHWMSERLGQQVVIDNRAGAGSNVGTEAVIRSAPDGYTLLFVNAANAINATLYDKLDFDFIRDIAPVGAVIRVPNVVVVNPSLPVTTIPDFIRYAKANPGQLNMGSGGIGTTVHVAGELFKMMAGVDLVHVPYRGAGPALIDLMAGQVQVMFDAVPNSIGYIRGGRLRPLAVTTTARSDVLPDLPTVADTLPGYEASSWYGIGAPKKTPAEIVDKLNTVINAALADPQLKARFAEIGGTVLPGSPAEFARLIVEETDKWGKVVKFSGARAN